VGAGPFPGAYLCPPEYGSGLEDLADLFEVRGESAREVLEELRSRAEDALDLALSEVPEGSNRGPSALATFPCGGISRRRELCLPAHGGSELLRHWPVPLSMVYPRQNHDCAERQAHTEARHIIAGLVERIPPS
jgi:hypothetical protein